MDTEKVIIQNVSGSMKGSEINTIGYNEFLKKQADSHDMRIPYYIEELYGDRVLIDTGSPFSFGDIPEIVINGTTHKLGKNSLLDCIRKHTFSDVTALLGIDIMSLYDVIISEGTYEVEFIPKGTGMAKINALEEIQIDCGLNVPIFDIKIEGRLTSCFFDTGAHIQYINSAFVTGKTPAGEVEDYYPNFGRFNTNLYEIDIKIGKKPLSSKFGVLPADLELPLSALGIGAIVGMAAFEGHTVCLSAYNESLSLG